MRSGLPTSEISSTSASGTAATASARLPERKASWIFTAAVLVAELLGEIVVEVLRPRAHAADVERELRLQRIAAGLQIVAHGDADIGRDVEVGEAPAGRPLGDALQQRLGHHLCLLRRHEDRQHAVGHFARRPQPDRRDRGGVDRHARDRRAGCFSAACRGRSRPGPCRGSGRARRDARAAPRASGSCAGSRCIRGCAPSACRTARRASLRRPAARRRRCRSRKRLFDSACRVIAVIAVQAGVRAGICMMPVPALICVVRARIQAVGVTASVP